MFTIKIAGMTCNGCVKSLSNALKSLDPKADFKIDLATQTVNTNSDKTKEEITLTIEDAGFSVLGVE